MEIYDGWTYKRDTWFQISNERISIYIFNTIKASCRLHVCISPNDALIAQNIYREILSLFICEIWPSIPVVSVDVKGRPLPDKV